MQSPREQATEKLFQFRLSTEETAYLLSVSTQTLWRWRCQDRGPAFKKMGRSIKYHVGDVMNWIDKQKGLPSSDPWAEKGWI